MRRYLVTGGVGFIGYHTSHALLERGDSVAILDDFSDAPYPRAEKERNASDLLAFGADRVAIVEGSVTDPAAVAKLMEGVSGVVHLAGLAGVRPSFADPARYAKVNVEGTAVVLDAARAAGVSRIAFASSSSVYGDATPLPAQEDAPCVVPASPYAASKRAAELVASALCRAWPDAACAALRFFTVYGPRQRPEMAIALFTRCALAGRAIPLFGDGSMRRDFTHVADIVRGVLAVLDRAPKGFRVYNLGGAAPVTLTELVSAIARAAGVPVSVAKAAVPLGDVHATYADISRAERELGWRPEVALDEGLATVVAWARATPPA